MERKIYKTVLAFGFRVARCLLMTTGSALYLAATGTQRLAEVVGRRAKRVRVK